MNTQLLLTIAEAANTTRMSEGFIKAAIRSGELRSGKFGRNRRILVDDLRAWAVRIIAGNTTDHGQSPAETSGNQVIERTVGVRP